MRNLFIIWRREFAATFLSPVAYVFMVIFLAMTGAVFLQMVQGFAGSFTAPPLLLFKVLFYFWMPILVTVVTMRLFAEEKRSGSIELLMTAPVTDTQVVIGKYLGALSFLFISTVPAIGYIYILKYLSPGIKFIDSGAVIGGSLLLVVLAMFCTSIGLVVSLLTRNQIIAAVLCFSMVMLPFLLELLVVFVPRSVTLEMSHYLSFYQNMLDFLRGSIDTRPLIMYISGTFLLLFVSVKIMELQKWK